MHSFKLLALFVSLLGSLDRDRVKQYSDLTTFLVSLHRLVMSLALLLYLYRLLDTLHGAFSANLLKRLMALLLNFSNRSDLFIKTLRLLDLVLHAQLLLIEQLDAAL